MNNIPNSFWQGDYEWTEDDPKFVEFIFKWIAGGFKNESHVSNENWREWEEWGGALIDWMIENHFDLHNPIFNLQDILDLDYNDADEIRY